MSPKQIAKGLAGFGAVALAVLMGVTIYVVRHRAAAPSIATVAGLIPGSLLHAHNFSWTQMKAGERQWVLSARDANYSDDKTSLILNQPVLSMTAQDGKAVKVEAPKAVLNLDGNKIKRADLSGGTTIHYGDFVVITDEATFIPDSNKIAAPGFVTIESEGLKVTGIGLTGDTKTRDFVLLKQVTTYITPKKNRSQIETKLKG